MHIRMLDMIADCISNQDCEILLDGEDRNGSVMASENRRTYRGNEQKEPVVILTRGGTKWKDEGSSCRSIHGKSCQTVELLYSSNRRHKFAFTIFQSLPVDGAIPPNNNLFYIYVCICSPLSVRVPCCCRSVFFFLTSLISPAACDYFERRV